jgi:DNA mismatch endonuclease (patch repair protein)
MSRRTDTVSKEKRSEIMRAVRSRGNRVTELVLVRMLRHHQINGWRRHAALAGNPDFVFRKQKLVVFVDGCFWHGCAKHCRMPKGNSSYWNPKIASNKARDRKVNGTLRRAGWRVLRIWEHDLARSKHDRCVARMTQALRVRTKVNPRRKKGQLAVTP